MRELPFSQSCENNKAPILQVLQQVMADRRVVLELASGTGQHACHFAGAMPWLQWQPTDLGHNLSVLQPRCDAYAGDNLLKPLALDVRDDPWPVSIPDAIFTANSLHIMPFDAVRSLFRALGDHRGDNLLLAIYGPFNYHGQYTSPSNAQFDQWLAQQHPLSAIRDFERVEELAAGARFVLQDDLEMPANNRLLLWRRKG